MTETGGGCVYDGVPLPGVRVRTTADGRVEIAGAVLASGYLDEPDGGPFAVEAGERWLRTSDRGRLDHGLQGVRLTVLGRVDDLINTGGVKVSPAAVERVAGPGVVVVGVPDDEWGELVTAVTTAGTSLAELRAAVSAELGAAHAPRALVHVDALPLRGPGKVDRLAVARLAREALADAGRHGVEQHSVEQHSADSHANDRHGVEQHSADRHANDRHGVDRHPGGPGRPIS
jgi:O-succinylbenzoic acid--CoA ligase